jgi:hypothetical protein
LKWYSLVIEMVMKGIEIMLIISEREARERYTAYTTRILYSSLKDIAENKWLSFNEWITEHKIKIF